MKYYVMTLFPEMIEQAMNTSIMGRAMADGLISLQVMNIRDYTLNKHGKVDDYPYGGGAGMVMEAEPIYRCYEQICSEAGKRPRGAASGAAMRRPSSPRRAVCSKTATAR